MKKLIVLLALILIFVNMSISISYGESDFEAKLEEAVSKAKELFEISEKYDKFSSNINLYDGDAKFNLRWSDTSEKLSDLNITMDIDGNLISYDKYPVDYDDSKNKLAKYSREQAEEIAMNFIKKVSADIESIKLSEDSYTYNLYDEDYMFVYTRYVNEIEYSGNRISVNVNKYTGEVTNYYIEWERQAEFPTPKNTIDQDRAKEIFKEKIGLKPVYKMKSNYYEPLENEDQKDRYYIAYTVLNTNQAIDAFTGERVNVDSYGLLGNEMVQDEAATEVDAGITPEERVEIDKLKGILSEKEAEEKAREILNIEEKYKLENQNLYKSYKNAEDYIWDLYFINEEDKDARFDLSISIDAKTGQLLSFYKFKDYSEDKEKTIKEDEALKLAKEYLDKQNKDKKDSLELVEDTYEYMGSNNESKTHQFEFTRKEKDIYVEGDGIYIGVDAADGDIISYSMDWYKGDFPSKESIISIDKAYDILWEKIGLELNYVKIQKYDTEPTIEANKNNTVNLVYILNPDKPPIIDANTGDILDYSGEPLIEKESISYSDIEDSYAKDKIETLAKYGIGFEDGEFNPKQEIKQSEYIYLLWKSINQYRTDMPDEKDMYDDFIKWGYIEESEKNPDSLVSKVDGVKYIIRIMELKEVAEIEEIYEDIFEDSKSIEEDEKGYINIAYGLNIIYGDGSGEIKPDYSLKREDAANIIYNYLFR